MVLSLCDRTGNMVRPWAEAGYECLCLDLQHSVRNEERRNGIRFVWGDVRAFWPEGREIAIAFAFPPCTHLASSGARDWQQKGLTALIDALAVVEACRRICTASGAPWMLENPVGRLSTCWREPDHTFDPCDYAGYLDWPEQDAYTKRTCLWTGGGFEMPQRRRVAPIDGSRMHRLPPTFDRANRRSETPMGFARAVFAANARPSQCRMEVFA